MVQYFLHDFIRVKTFNWWFEETNEKFKVAQEPVYLLRSLDQKTCCRFLHCLLPYAKYWSWKDSLSNKFELENSRAIAFDSNFSFLFRVFTWDFYQRICLMQIVQSYFWSHSLANLDSSCTNLYFAAVESLHETLLEFLVLARQKRSHHFRPYHYFCSCCRYCHRQCIPSKCSWLIQSL